MKNTWKKSLAVAGILAALFATSAFAASTDTANTTPAPAGQTQNDADFHQAPPPPEGQNKNGQPPKLTDAQKQKLDQERKEIFANWPNMTKEERMNAHKQFMQKVREEQMKNMTAKEKEAFMKKEAQREKERAAFKAKWDKMTPEQKEQWRQKKHQEMLSERTKNMSAEDKKKFLERDAEMQKKRAEFREQWNKMTPAEKEQWKKAHPQRPFNPMMGPGPVQPGQTTAKAST